MGSGLEELGIIDDSDENGGATQQAERRRPRGATVETEGDERTAMLVRTLRKVSLFEGLLPLHLKRIGALCQEVELAPTEAVFNHGDPGDGLYLILEGAVRGLPDGGSGSFISTLSLGSDGTIRRYISFYCEPAIPLHA